MSVDETEEDLAYLRRAIAASVFGIPQTEHAQLISKIERLAAAAELRGKRGMLGEISMALLSDRSTSHQRDDWAPVLKRIQDKYDP